MKQKSMVSVSYLGVTGEGVNASAAKKDAEARIERSMAGPYEPYFLVHQSLVAFVSRQATGSSRQWGYKVVNPGDAASVQSQFVDLNYSSRDEAVCAAAYSLAQRSMTFVGLERHLSPNQLVELQDYFDWQTLYRLHHKNGQSDHETRQIVDGILTQRRYARLGVAA